VDKIWLTQYPPGVPAEIDADAYASLVEIFEQNCARYAERTAFSNFGSGLSYQELAVQSLAFAAYLQQELGLQPGERVALMMPNLLQYPIALFGCLRAGLTVVNVNPLYTPRELLHQLQDAEASAIVVLSNFAHVLAAVQAQTKLRHVIVTEVGDCFPFFKRHLFNFVVRYIKRLVPTYRLPQALSFHAVLAQGRRLSFTPVPIRRTDLAFLQYTGGTTGVAKGAMLSHRNMLANMQQVSAWIGEVITGDKEVALTALPLYHIFCLTANCLCFMQYGVHNLLITNPRDMSALVASLRKTPPTLVTGVNTLFNALLNVPGFAQLDFSRLKLSVGGGSAVQPAVAERWQRVTGRPILEGYGLTESSPVVCVNPRHITHFTNSIGLPLPSTEISLRDEQGHEVALGQPGELWVHGPQVMQGYWRRPKDTAEVLTPDGWLKTGDIATVDAQGFVRIVDRKKDLILVSGFNVYPNEIEEVVSSHPGVLEVACIGIPDAKSGEAVKIFVVPKPGTVILQNTALC